LDLHTTAERDGAAVTSPNSKSVAYAVLIKTRDFNKNQSVICTIVHKVLRTKLRPLL
jgi:hypothetical protein